MVFYKKFWKFLRRPPPTRRRLDKPLAESKKSHPRTVWVLFYWKNKKFTVFQTRKVSKKFLKINEKVIIFWKFVRKFCDFLKIFLNFIEIIAKILGNVRKFWRYRFVGVKGAVLPEARESIKNLAEKSMENCKILKVFTNLWRILTWKG